MDPPRPPSPPSGPPRGTCASCRNVEAPAPPSPARSQTFTLSRNIRTYLRMPPAGSRASGSVVPKWIDSVRARLPGGADPDLEVAVRPGGPAAHADPPDALSPGDGLSRGHRHRAHM